MNNPHVLCAIAMTFYAVEMTITDKRLQDVHPRFLTLCYSGIIFVLTLIWLAQNRDEVELPKGSKWVPIILMGVVSFIAAHAHFSALHKNAGAVQLGLYYALLPVVASLVDVAITRELPSIRIVIGWLLGAASLWCVTGAGAKP